MSRKTRRKQSSTIQSLEQLILMSASGTDAEVLSAADAQEVELSSIPDFEQLALEETGSSERPEVQLLEEIPADEEFVFPTVSSEIDLAAPTGIATTSDLPIGEGVEILPLSNNILLETPDGDVVEIAPGELVEAISFDGEPMEVDGGEPGEILILEGPNGEIIEVPPSDELPPFLFEDFVVDPAAATGAGSEPSAPFLEIDGSEPPEILILEGPNGELVEVMPGDELPQFLFDAEFDPASATGIGVGSPEIAVPPIGSPIDAEVFLVPGPDGELVEVMPGDELPEFLFDSEFDPAAATGSPERPVAELVEVSDEADVFEFLPVDGEVNPIFATGNAGVTSIGSDGDIIELPEGVAAGNAESFENSEPGSLPPIALESIGGFPVSDADLAAASGAAGSGGVGSVAEDGDISDLDFVTMELDGSAALDSALQDALALADSNDAGLPVADVLTQDSVIFQSAAAGGSAAAAASILGSDVAEWIAGTVGDDIIEAGAGNDEIYASVGNNIVDGGTGEDTLVVYEGDQANYTITKQADGVTVFEGPGLNGETVRVELTNVEQILFNDGMVRLADLASDGTSAGNTSTVAGTAAGEWIAGTGQDDEIVGGGGDDKIYAPIGTNKIDGGEGVDTLVVYEGSRADFVLSNLGNGTIYLEGPGLNGETVRSELTNVEVILFNDGAILTSGIQDL